MDALAQVEEKFSQLATEIVSLDVQVGDAIVTTRVYDCGSYVVIPISGELADGGFLQSINVVDKASYQRGRELARRHGLTFVRLADLVERVMGRRPVFSVQPRALRAR